MNTLITTFAIAVMVFALNANSVAAGEKVPEKPAPKTQQLDSYDPNKATCDSVSGCIFGEAESRDGVGERDIADSGNEGSTSAASASDQ